MRQYVSKTSPIFRFSSRHRRDSFRSEGTSVCRNVTLSPTIPQQNYDVRVHVFQPRNFLGSDFGNCHKARKITTSEIQKFSTSVLIGKIPRESKGSVTVRTF